MRCAVSNCGNNNRNGNRKKWRYFHFPKEEQQLQKWIEFCERSITNTSTACICNEHFTPDDFERNMQYELGFTRKNPTKLKPGSFPTIHRPQDKKLKDVVQNKRMIVNNKPHCSKDEAAGAQGSYPLINTICSPKNTPPIQTTPNTEAENLEKLELFGCVDEFEDMAESNISLDETIEMIEYISETDEYLNTQVDQTEVDNNAPFVGRLEVAIIDPLNPQTNAEDHVEIIDSESEHYVRHLELELSTLKRQVFFLKDERKKLLAEIQNLRATVRTVRQRHLDAVEKLKNVKTTRKRPLIKKTVLLYKANIDTYNKTT